MGRRLVGRDLGTALWIGLGWASIEIVYSIANGFADLQKQAVSGFTELWTQISVQFGLEGELASYSQDILDQLEAQQGAIVSGALGAAATAGSVLVGALIALFCTFFFLHDPRGIWR